MGIFAATIFLGAFLLFQVEPMIAKYILPWFGGSAAVWTTCLLFFQMLLVAGYGYAHLVGTRLNARGQAITQLALVAGCAALMAALTLIWKSPIMPSPSWKPPAADFPISRILLLLTVSIGLPYFVLSTTGPLLQLWFARSHLHSPYRLYSISNLGSLLALLSYPFIVEPALRLRTQSIGWFALYLLFAIGMGLCAFVMTRSPSEAAVARTEVEDDQATPTASTYLLWIALAGCASLMLIASTNQMTQDIAPIPFLWILPLTLYLLSFIICFDNERRYRRAIFHPALLATIFISLILLVRSDAADSSMNWFGIAANRVNLTIQIATAAALLFTLCMVCHGELVRMRPHARNLTAFYLMVAIGGAVGGIIGAVVAPLLFRGYWEFRLAISLALVLMFVVLIRDRDSWIHLHRPVIASALLVGSLALPQVLGAGMFSWEYELPQIAVAVMCVLVLLFRKRFARPILSQLALLTAIVEVAGLSVTSAIVGYRTPVLLTRNFYGVLRVMTNSPPDPEWKVYQLGSGRIMHGAQFPAPGKRYEPTSYYGPSSGIGLVMANLPNRAAPDPKDWPVRVGVVGLGTGTMSAWGEVGDYFRYYEINPEIVRIATDPHGYFTYISDSIAQVEIVVGDARLSMERELAAGQPGNFDVLVIDAFSGDAIPVHLLTREAMATYLREIKPDGIIALHISNRFLNLEPLTRELARAFDLHGGIVIDRPRAIIYDDSDWVVLVRDDKVLAQLGMGALLKPLDGKRNVRLWTDDYSNMFQLIR